MKIAIYSRKSKFTGKGESIGNQIEMCKEYITSHFGECELIIYEDEGFSGGSIDRPQFKQMLADAQAKKFDTLVCYRLDRISRNIADFSSLIEDLGLHNINFVSIREQFDTTTPMGRAMMYIASVFAQLERETIAERIRDNMLQLAKTGRWLGGITPTGFESIEIHAEDAHGKMRKAFKLSPIESELKMVKLIFDKYLELESLTQVETYLLQHHMTTKNGGNFTRFTIRTLLNNPVYAKADEDVYHYFDMNNYEIYVDKEDFNGVNGIMAYNKTIQKKNKSNKLRDASEWIIAIGQHEGIIDGKDWVKVQELINQNKSKTFRKTRNQDALLSGILRCSKCGSYMRPKMGRTLKDGSQMFYYLCELKEASKSVRCDCRNAPGPKIDTAVIDFLNKASDDQSLVRSEMSDIKINLKNHSEMLNTQIQSVKDKILSNEEAIKNLVSTLSLSEQTAAGKYIIDQINTLDRQTATLKEELFNLNQKATFIEMESHKHELMDNLVLSIGTTIKASKDIVGSRNQIRTLIDKVLWDGEDLDIIMIGSTHDK